VWIRIAAGEIVERGLDAGRAVGHRHHAEEGAGRVVEEFDRAVGDRRAAEGDRGREGDRLRILPAGEILERARARLAEEKKNQPTLENYGGAIRQFTESVFRYSDDGTPTCSREHLSRFDGCSDRHVCV